MAEFYEVVNKIIENDLNDEPSEQEEVAEEREAQDSRALCLILPPLPAGAHHRTWLSLPP